MGLSWEQEKERTTAAPVVISFSNTLQPLATLLVAE